jgi:Leucine-rich repeat (LRR) protein
MSLQEVCVAVEKTEALYGASAGAATSVATASSDSASQLASSQAVVRGHVAYLRSRAAQLDMLAHMAWAQSPLSSLDAQLRFVTRLVEGLREQSVANKLAQLGRQLALDSGSHAASVERAAAELGAVRQLVQGMLETRLLTRGPALSLGCPRAAALWADTLGNRFSVGRDRFSTALAVHLQQEHLKKAAPGEEGTARTGGGGGGEGQEEGGADAGEVRHVVALVLEDIGPSTYPADLNDGRAAERLSVNELQSWLGGAALDNRLRHYGDMWRRQAPLRQLFEQLGGAPVTEEEAAAAAAAAATAASAAAAAGEGEGEGAAGAEGGSGTAGATAAAAVVAHDGWRRRDRWLQAKSVSELGSWYGLQEVCHGELLVLDLSANRLRGALVDVPLLASCDALTYLDLSSNELRGPVPSALRGCGRLRVLWLNSNLLEGALQPASATAAGAATGDAAAAATAGLASGGSLLSSRLGGGAAGARAAVHDDPSDTLFSAAPHDVGAHAAAAAAQVAAFPQLEMLHLQYNKLRGCFPSALAGCGALTSLNLSWNTLTGPLPPALACCRSLQRLEASNNALAGELPPCWFGADGLARLELLDLSYNRLSGALPPALFGATALTSLQLWSNRLSGALPERVSELTRLEHLALHSNQLGGELPLGLAALTRLKDLSLHGNYGDAGADGGGAQQQPLRLPAMGEEGAGAASAAELPDLDSAELDAGTVVAALRRAKRSRVRAAQEARATAAHEEQRQEGEAEVQRRRDAAAAAAAEPLAGAARDAAEDAEKEARDAAEAALSELKAEAAAESEGQLRRSAAQREEARWAALERARRLRAERGFLLDLRMGTAFDRWRERGGWAALSPLPADDAAARSALAEEVGEGGAAGRCFGVRVDDEGHVTSVQLPGNGLDGNLPLSVGACVRLRTLDLFDNRLKGGIPHGIGRCTALTHLDLGVNRLSGRVPPSLSSLGRLRDLWIGSNQLSGELPDGLLSCSSLTSLWACGNRFRKGKAAPSRDGDGAVGALVGLDRTRHMLEEHFGDALAVEF